MQSILNWVYFPLLVADFTIHYQWKPPENGYQRFHNETVYLPALRFLGYSFRTGHEDYFPRLFVDLFISRSIAFYLARFYLPAFFVVIISFLPLYLAPNSHSKVSLGVMVMLTMTTLLTNTNSELPKISYLTSLDVYLFFCFFSVFLAVLQYAIIGYYDSQVVSLAAKKTKNGKIKRKDVENAKQKIEMKRKKKKVAQSRSKLIDYAARWLFLIIFALFNVVYIAILTTVAIDNSQVDIHVKHIET